MDLTRNTILLGSGAANTSTFRPKQEDSFPMRSLPVPPTEVAGMQTRPNIVQKAKLPPQLRALNYQADF